MNNYIRKGGFTLIEIMVVVAIMGILASLISGNFLSSLVKGRDAHRKADLKQIQTALELYYEDKKAYPLTSTLVFDGDSSLSDSVSGKIYMQKIPTDPRYSGGAGSPLYIYCVNSATYPTMYQLYALLENNQDPSIFDPSLLSECTGTTCKGSTECNYGIASSNATP